MSMRSLTYQQGDITVTDISRSFTHKMAAKINWNEITSLPPYVYSVERLDAKRRRTGQQQKHTFVFVITIRATWDGLWRQLDRLQWSSFSGLQCCLILHQGANISQSAVDCVVSVSCHRISSSRHRAQFTAAFCDPMWTWLEASFTSRELEFVNCAT